MTDHKVGAKKSRHKNIIKIILKITGVLDTWVLVCDWLEQSIYGHKRTMTDHKVRAKKSRQKNIIKIILKITGVLDTWVLVWDWLEQSIYGIRERWPTTKLAPKNPARKTMLIYLAAQSILSFSSHKYAAMSHESLEAFDNDYETWCEKNALLAAYGVRSELAGPLVIVSVARIEPGIKFFFILNPSIPGSKDAKLLFKQLCSKWAEHKDANLPTGSPKSTRCQRTSLTHWALTLGSEGNKCVKIPGVYCVFVQLSPLDVPATQYRPPFFTGFLLLSAMFCCESSRLTSHKQVTWPFGRALPATLLKRKYRVFQLEKTKFQTI